MGSTRRPSRRPTSSHDGDQLLARGRPPKSCNFTPKCGRASRSRRGSTPARFRSLGAVRMCQTPWRNAPRPQAPLLDDFVNFMDAWRMVRPKRSELPSRSPHTIAPRRKRVHPNRRMLPWPSPLSISRRNLQESARSSPAAPVASVPRSLGVFSMRARTSSSRPGHAMSRRPPARPTSRATSGRRRAARRSATRRSRPSAASTSS